MSANLVAFSIVQILATGFALWKGGSPERLVSAALVAAGLATLSIPLTTSSYHQVYWSLLAEDVLLLMGLVAVALVADRFWPMWLAALQLLAVTNHGVRAIDSDLLPGAYWLVAGKIAYPMLAILVVATLRHRRRRLSGKPEWAWTFQRRGDEGARDAGADR